MRTRCLRAVGLLLLVGALGLTVADAAPVEAPLWHSVVRIVMGTSGGCGVVTGPRTVLTCWHVVDDLDAVAIFGWDGTGHTASKWRRLRPDADIALVEFDHDLGYPALLPGPVPAKAAVCECVGYWGYGWTLASKVYLRGEVWPSLRIFDDGMSFVAVAVPLDRGLSGAPLILGRRVIALASRQASDAAPVSHFVETEAP